jgi:hypothetical protein
MQACFAPCVTSPPPAKKSTKFGAGGVTSAIEEIEGGLSKGDFGRRERKNVTLRGLTPKTAGTDPRDDFRKRSNAETRKSTAIRFSARNEDAGLTDMPRRESCDDLMNEIAAGNRHSLRFLS